MADEKWSDLEVALGQYTDVFNGENMVDDAIDFHDKLSAAILKYLETQSHLLKRSEDLFKQFRKYLLLPYEDGRLNPDEVYQLNSFKKHWQNTSQWGVRVITFNYTDSIQKTCGCTNDLKIGSQYGREVLFREMEHIHGYHNNRQILGVNDESQISNESLRGTEAMDWYIKSRNNITNGMGCQNKCLSWIHSANLICIFGMSYGPTDMIWWQAIIDRLLVESNVRLLLFVYDMKNNFNNNQAPHKNRFKRQEKQRFIKASAKILTEKQMELLMSKIYVGYNTDIFTCKEIAVLPA